MTSLDDRLEKLFGSIDVDPDFDVRLLARVRATDIDREAARQREQADHAIAGSSLKHWRRAALRMFSLDAIAAATLLLVLIAALPRVAPKIDAASEGYVVAAIAALFAIATAIRLLYPRVRLLGNL